MTRVKTDTTAATSVHVKGSGTSGGATVKLDISMASDGRAYGTIDPGTGPLTIVRADGKDYVQLTDAYIAQQKYSASVGNLVRGKYFQLAASDAAGVDQLMDMKTFIAQANGDTTKYTINGTTDVNGQTAFVLNGDDGSILYVAAQGKALPLRILGPPSNPGQLDFTGWNTDLSIPAAPPADQIIDLSQLPKS